MAYLAASSLSWPLIRETIQLISKQSGHPSPRGRRGFPGWCWYWEGVGLAACVCPSRLSSAPRFLASDNFNQLDGPPDSPEFNCIVSGRSGRRTVGYKADTFNWPKWTLWTWVGGHLQKVDRGFSWSQPLIQRKPPRFNGDDLKASFLVFWGLDTITSIYHQWAFSLSSSHRETSSSSVRGRRI